MEAKYIIWDFDGTLYDTYGNIVTAFACVLQENHQLSVAAERIYALVKVDTRHCAQQLAEEYHLDPQALLVTAREAYNTVASSEQRPFDDVREACKKILASGGQNFLVTHRDRASLDALLAAHDFGSVFTAIITSDDGFAEKPSADSFNYLIDKYRLPLNKTYGIGDRELDVVAAKSAGLSSVYFCPRGGKNKHADINISSFNTLCALIESG